MVVGQLEIQLLANMARLQSDMEKAQRTVGNVVGKINGILGAIGVGISVDFLLDLARKSNEYQKSLSALSTQLGNATHQVKEFDAASRSLAVQFGTDALKQSAAFYEILSVGITDTAEATELLTQANRLAIGGASDLQVSIDGLTGIIKGYGEAAGTAAEISDTLFTASLAGKISIEELSSGLGKVIPVAATLGVNLEELTASIAALTLGNVQPREAITGVRAILASVAKPSSEAATLAKQLGLEFNAAAIQAKGFAGFLEEVKVKTQGSASQMAILFGGVEAFIPAVALAENAGVEFNNILGQMAHKAGATEEAFNKMAASPGFKWDQFMAIMSNIAITLGDALANVLTPAAEMAAKALNKLFGFNDVTGIEKQVQLVNQLTEKVESMTNRTHIPLIGGILFDKKEFDLLEHQLEMAKEELAAMQKVQEGSTGATKQDTVALQQNVEALEQHRRLLESGAETAKKYADPLKAMQELQARFKEELDAGAISQDVYNRALRSTRDEYARKIDSSKGARKAIDELNKAQANALRMEEEYIKLLQIEKRQRQDLIAPYKDAAKQATNRLNSMDEEIASLRLVRDRQISLRQAVELTTIAKLEESRASVKSPDVLKQINAEITARKQLADLIPIQEKLSQSTRNTTDEMSQMWIQAGRNIQSALGNLVFDSFNDGLKGMIRNAGNAVLRIMSEFAGLKIAQSIGLAGMFTMPGAANASGVGGTGANLLDMASLGSNAASLFKSGFGLTGLASSGLKGLGSLLGSGSLSAFGAGMSGVGTAGASAGIFSAAGGAGTAFIGGPGTALGGAGMGGAATMGASFAAVAGPAIALAAVDAIGRMLAGDKKLGGAEMIPVIGGFMAALFGRGPYKFRQQSLQGTASADGFDGDITNVFRAKGGLLRSNGHKSVTEQFSLEQQTLLDDSLKGFYGSAHQFAVNLGLSTDLVDNFTQEIQIKSEKGKQVTEEAIAEMLDGIGNSLAQNVLPIVDTLRKAGEDSFATLTRLNTEFMTLTQAAQNLGASAAYAKEIVSGLSFETRTRYVDAAGGPDELIRLTSRFGEIFLTEAERMAPAIEFVENGLESLGISATISKDALGDLIQTLIQSASDADKAKALLLLQNQEAFNLVNNYKQSLSANGEIAQSSAEALGEAFAILRKSVDAERKSATDQYNDALEQVNSRIQNVTDSINKLKSLSSALANTVDVLRPISREEAKFQILSAINTAKLGGGLPDVADISKALNVLQSNNIIGVRSSFELAREQAKTANLVGDLGSLTDAQLSVEERSLLELQEQRRKLTDGFEQEMLRLDSLLEQGQKEIDTLNGLDSTILTLAKAIELFNLRSVQAGGGGGIGGGAVSGNPDISDQTIRDFVNTPGRTEMEIYNAAKQNGVSFEQYAAATGAKLEDLYAWARKNNVDTFASGGMHSGGLRIVGERGPELEFTGPSRIISNQDTKKLLNNEELANKVESLTQELAVTNKALDKTQAALSQIVSTFNKVIVDESGRPALFVKQRAA